jgi:hypothetical protein
VDEGHDVCNALDAILNGHPDNLRSFGYRRPLKTEVFRGLLIPLERIVFV